MKSVDSIGFSAFGGALPSLLVLLTALNASAQPPGGPPPGGPPPGGPPMMMMGGGPFGGGPWGGGGDRGGDRRGGWGGGGFGGGGGGGFDPSQFLTRMDTNGNGSLDPEEVQGPARFMLDRMARNNPKIDVTKPIPISVLTESFQQMRGGGGGGGFGGPWGGGDDESIEMPEQSLVPGFGVKVERPAVPGFGASGALLAIQVDERDLREADERMRRYDRNNDGFLDENEVKEARWSDSLSQWDRNRDGRLSRQEVAARYARRREQRQDQESKNRGADDGRARQQQPNGEAEKAQPTRPFEKISSYRLGGTSGGPVRPSGLPEWFVRDDADGDNQVSMNEFARKWDASTLEDFNKFDPNSDGYITAKECLAGVKKGYLKGSSPSSSSSSESSKPSSSEGESKPAAKSSGGGDDFAQMIEWSKKTIAKKDKDKNGFLTPDEFTDSVVKFGDVDTNGNGQIDIEEYAKYRQNRSQKK